MKILIISVSDLDSWNELHGTEKSYHELTDEEFIQINKEFNNSSCVHSLEELIDEINTDGTNAPIPDNNYVRVIKEPETFFPITSININV